MTDTLLVPGRIVVVQWLKIRIQPHTTDDTALIRTLPGKTGKVDGCVKICGRAGIFAITPEELSAETIEDSLDFSLEYLTRYEEEVNRNKEALVEKERLMQVLREQKDRVISEKDDALAEKDQQIQAEQSRNAELEAELAEYRKRDEEKKQRKQARKKVALLIWGIIWRVAVIAGVLVGTIYICKKVDPSVTTAVSIVVSLLGLIPAIRSFVKKDLKKYKEPPENE